MRALIPGLVCCALLIAAAPAAAAGPRRCGDDVGGRAIPCDCGDVLIGSRTLGADDPITSRVCPGGGLLVAVSTGAPAARLALGGHVLAGSGRGVGIQVVGGGAGGLTIAGPGGVRGFATGIQAVNGTLARLADVVAADNASDGFVLAGEGFAVLGSEASHNGRDGFVLRGHRYRVERNRALANGRHGFVARGREAAIGGEAGNGTDDRCDTTEGCKNTPKTTFAAVTCRLDTVDAAIHGASATDLAPSVAAKLGKPIGKVRTKLAAAETAGHGKPALKALKKSAKQLKTIPRIVRAAQKRHKIAAALATAILDAASGGSQALSTLMASITP